MHKKNNFQMNIFNHFKNIRNIKVQTASRQNLEYQKSKNMNYFFVQNSILSINILHLKIFHYTPAINTLSGNSISYLHQSIQ